MILPFHNRRDTLREAVDSVLEQTHRSLTLHLVDDGSTDGSADVLADIDDPRVVRHTLETNVGVSAARNVGLDHAATDFVAFMDSDDVWLPHKLATQFRFLSEIRQRVPDVSVLGCGWLVHPDVVPPYRFEEGPFRRSDVLRRAVYGITTPALLVDRRAAAPEARFDELLPALVDRDYVMSCLSNGSALVVVPEPLYLYRRGRHDHVANPLSAARAYERMIHKFADEMRADPALRSWFAYRACREHVARRDLRAARAHVVEAVRFERWRRALQLGLGALAGQKGFSVAQRVAPTARAVVGPSSGPDQR